MNENGATLDLNTGFGINDGVTLSLMAIGRVEVTSSNITELVRALYVDGARQAPGIYHAADLRLRCRE